MVQHCIVTQNLQLLAEDLQGDTIALDMCRRYVQVGTAKLITTGLLYAGLQLLNQLHLLFLLWALDFGK